METKTTKVRKAKKATAKAVEPVAADAAVEEVAIIDFASHKPHAYSKGVKDEYTRLFVSPGWGTDGIRHDRDRMIRYENTNKEESSIMLEYDGYFEAMTLNGQFIVHNVEPTHKDAAVIQLEMMETNWLLDDWFNTPAAKDYPYLVKWYQESQVFRRKLIEELKNAK